MKCTYKKRKINIYKIVRYSYVYVDGVYLQHNLDEEFENAAILIAIVVDVDVYCDFLS